VKEKITKVTTPLIDSVKNNISPDGSKLYIKCAGCHGQNAQNAALGKSQIIKGWNKTKIVNSLKGYQNGTYGGTMKAIMKSQVADLTENEIDALAKHIASF
jgi:cytochrome c553